MIVAAAILAPLAVQAIAMAFDELHFHRRRGLGRWERLGHPIDTLTMLACVGWVRRTEPTPGNMVMYAALATFSCLFITKDEFVHAERCTPGEHWIHALLFVVHPMTLGAIGLLWLAAHPNLLPAIARWSDAAFARSAIDAELVATAGFCLYQMVYWNNRWIPRARLER